MARVDDAIGRVYQPRMTGTWTVRYAAALIVAVGGFVGASSAGIIMLGTITRDAHSIAYNAAPSVYHLSEMRLALRRLELHLLRLTPDNVEAHSDELRELRNEQRHLTRAWLAYQQGPTYPGERVDWSSIEAELARLEAAAADLGVQSARAAGRPMRNARNDVVKAADRVTVHLDELTNFNVAHARQRAETIEQTRQRHALVVLGLDILAALGAIAAFWLTYRAIRRYEAELRARTRELDQFAGRVAHDIVSPLSTAKLAFEALSQQKSADAPEQRWLGRGAASIDRVTQTVDALLAFARSGARAKAGARADVAEVIRAVIEEAHPQADQEGVSLGTAVSSHDQLCVPCSPELLAVAVENLVRNALKYMPEREPRRIMVEARRWGKRARIEVTDTGAGIDPEVGIRIFEPYVRVSGAQKPGLGLGLATVRRIVESHGGMVGVDSAPIGACVWFALPLATATVPGRPRWRDRLWPGRRSRVREAASAGGSGR